MSDSDVAVPTDFFRAVELERFTQSISNIAAHNNINFADFQAVQSQVTELSTNLDQSTVADSVFRLGKKYSWALGPLSILFATVIGEE